MVAYTYTLVQMSIGIENIKDDTQNTVHANDATDSDNSLSKYGSNFCPINAWSYTKKAKAIMKISKMILRYCTCK